MNNNRAADNFCDASFGASQNGGRLAGKTALVTGGAQGFGAGIAARLLSEGACVMIADLEQKRQRAQSVIEPFGSSAAFAACDVSVEDDAASAVAVCVERFGSLDILVSNAGVTGAGGLQSLSTADFHRIRSVNYDGYYYMVKHASAVMKAQYERDNDRFGDIIQINSKSGLTGSKANFAYSGSKFGGIGLTRSFALELAPYKIKVNAVCPGNYYEGDLWADPENGLFTQFLRAGKVPGAVTAADVKQYYLSRQPFSFRGCLPEDVALAVLYCIEQKFETGQVITITGGQTLF